MLSINVYYITPNRSSVCATVHQGMPASKALSRKCMFNALASAIANEKLSVETWTQKTGRQSNSQSWRLAVCKLLHTRIVSNRGRCGRLMRVDGVNYKINLQEPCGERTRPVNGYTQLHNNNHYKT
ncbi:hypothetical protein PoB_006717700 [Plakobranchus ocellatus]|uniref:Uncharacterized protein n=1 Tax=Plakobranchus ocellatus TaxID=259542 RepID=A0AAV4D9B1_9GAST|nr:hypothetical protein PoB_006717700 [Plakobranchus ocellatus]